MRVYLGSDHAGFELKDHLLRWLEEAGHEPVGIVTRAHLRQVEIAARAVDHDAVRPQGRQLGSPHEERDVVPRVGQPRTEVSADPAGSHDRYTHACPRT
jgi:hypothetical protein